MVACTDIPPLAAKPEANFHVDEMSWRVRGMSRTRRITTLNTAAFIYGPAWSGRPATASGASDGIADTRATVIHHSVCFQNPQAAASNPTPGTSQIPANQTGTGTASPIVCHAVHRRRERNTAGSMLISFR